ncbi:hypothetical protein [Burkholderia gladioli]|uniref:hypothetical protein n=1 Tax=Burkholderia gladioli TaxID=28095 RepID=UPI00163FC377|nr:hypothetical protein [Burkholderia gladioli]
MKSLYARFVLFLIRPALAEHSKRTVPNAAQMEALSERIDYVASVAAENERWTISIAGRLSVIDAGRL